MLFRSVDYHSSFSVLFRFRSPWPRSITRHYRNCSNGNRQSRAARIARTSGTQAADPWAQQPVLVIGSLSATLADAPPVWPPSKVAMSLIAMPRGEQSAVQVARTTPVIPSSALPPDGLSDNHKDPAMEANFATLLVVHWVRAIPRTPVTAINSATQAADQPVPCRPVVPVAVC